MQKLKRYLGSFGSMIKLLNSLRSRLNIAAFRFFGNKISKHISKELLNYYDSSFITDDLDNILAIPSDFFEELDLEEVVLIKSKADRFIHDVFNLLGSGEKKLDPVDWHADFKTGFRWAPGAFYKDYQQERIDTDSDVKVPRELSRCHHFLKLGLAYRISKEEQYALHCIKQMGKWIEENPLMHSINWGCTMDVSIRAVNWIWALGLISGVKLFNNAANARIKASLYEHGWFIYRNPEKNEYNNHNHYLADLTGQIYLGLIFKDLPEPKKWLENGIREIFREIRMQILPTGMSYERSTNYNRLVLELLLVPVLLLKRNGYEIPSDIWYRLEKMFEFIMYSLKPDGNTPIIGDQDDARLLPFGIETNTDYRYLLSLGSILFKRRDFKKYGNGYNVYCALLGGQKSKELYNNLKEDEIELTSRAFPDSGFYIMRSSDDYLLFNASGKGLYPELPSGTHTHSDLLSFELYSKGKTFLIDPGSYVYTADAMQRMLFRSTQMHNTVTVDGQSQNILNKNILWDFERNAIPEIICWESTKQHDLVIGRHNGFTRLVQSVIHQRTIHFDKQNSKWQIVDELSGSGSHQFNWFFHFNTDIDFNITGDVIKTNCVDGSNLVIIFSSEKKISLRKEQCFISKAYGVKEESFILIAEIISDCPTTMNILINPVVLNETII